MIKRTILAGAAGIALLSAAPAMAQDTADTMTDDVSAGMDEAMQMMSGLFQAEELTAEQEARLPAASAVVATMTPEGFYTEIMSDMMNSMMEPLSGMMSGDLAATGTVQSRLALGEEQVGALSSEERVELATILDPAFSQRGEALQSILTDMMTQTATLMEPLFREGLSRAYAVRFDEAELSDIAAFFATPTGSDYATQSMQLMADPQVMSASMQALPAMMSQFGDMESRMEEAFASLPEQNAYADLTAAQRERIAAITGIAATELSQAVLPPPSDEMADAQD
ncbi:MAG: DUF2059 domain-containing protein [Erythrobacter sp.]|uniref:DUF2059 domain-containing protein n=1 Tax=Erythrobacter sp. TaxID=1042 RepID=UPI003C73F131